MAEVAPFRSPCGVFPTPVEKLRTASLYFALPNGFSESLVIMKGSLNFKFLAVAAASCFLPSTFRLPAVHSSGSAKAAGNPVACPPAEEMKPYAETIPGANVKFEMAPIPGGTFTMGSPASEAKRSPDEGPQHEVTIRPFWMEKTETTWDEYQIFAFAQDLPENQRARAAIEPVGAKGADAITRPTPPYTDPTFGYGREGHPVINITHHAAMEYCRWLSAKTGKTYRLPTEAEWEYAARAGAKTAYFFGDDPRKLGEYAWYMDNSDARPHEVGKKKPNPWGLYDILGNVAEWCLDHYDKDYYKSFKPGAPVLSPVLMPSEKEYPYVVRGGSWDEEASRLRCAARLASTREWSQQDPQLPQSIWWHTDALFIGFRVIRPLEEQENLKGLKSKVKKG